MVCGGLVATRECPEGVWGWICGILLVGATVAHGEAEAAAAATERLEAGGEIVTDCQAVSKVWRGPAWRRKDNATALWVFQSIYRRAAEDNAATLRRKPVHLGLPEALRLGFAAKDWLGNELADSRAKLAAMTSGPLDELVKLRRESRATNANILKQAGAVLLSRLKARPRLATGAAVKTRQRKVPALPRRLKVKEMKVEALAR